MNFRIVRDHISTDSPTVGRLYAGDLDLFTLELPWQDNKPNISCIPEGRYKVTLAYSHRFQRVMPRILNVPSRDGILIHPLNEVQQTQGCVGVGMQRSDDERIIMGSKIAYGLFYQWLAEALRDGDVMVEVSYAS